MNQSKQLALGLKDTGTEFTITQAKAKAQIQVTLSQAKGFQQAFGRIGRTGLGLASINGFCQRITLFFLLARQVQLCKHTRALFQKQKNILAGKNGFVLNLFFISLISFRFKTSLQRKRKFENYDKRHPALKFGSNF